MLDNAKIRQQLIKKRQQLCEDEYRALSLLCYQNLLNWSLFQRAERIGLYCSVHHEVDTREIIADLLKQHKTVLLPKIISEKEMVFCEISDFSMLEVGRYHILAPKNNCRQSDVMDLLLVPLTGYDQLGHRLGMGGGYYDCYLSKHRPIVCGLAFSFQKTTFQVFPHDQKMNYLINEKERLTFA